MKIFTKEFRLLKTHPIRWMTETALLVSISVILHILAYLWSRSLWPQGGVVGVQFIPIIIAFYRLDFLSSTFVGFFGLILYTPMMGAFYVVNPWQFLLDYCSALVYVPVAAFVAIWFKSLKDQNKIYLPLSIILFTFVALIIHFSSAVLSGALFFASNAPIHQSAIMYSLIYNSTYLIPTYALSLIIVLMTLPITKNFFNIRNTY
jgi:thiamine transporter